MIVYLMAYALLATLVWGLLAWLLYPLSNVPFLLPALLWAYALLFGILEALNWLFWSPGLNWQVPARWIKGRSISAQAFIWGSALGPGLITRNPYASMWLLPLLVMVSHQLPVAIILGLIIGLVHGLARAIGILSNQEYLADTFSHLSIMGTQLYWRYLDGLLLLVVAGAFSAYLLSLLR